MKWLIKLIVGLLVFFIAGILLLAASLWVYDETGPGEASLAISNDHYPRDSGIFAGKGHNSICDTTDWPRPLETAQSGIQFELQCEKQTLLIKQLYQLGAENVWVLRKSQPTQLYIQLPDDPTVRQAIFDRVAAECACGNMDSHHHVGIGDGRVVVSLIVPD